MVNILQVVTTKWTTGFQYHFCIIENNRITYKWIVKNKNTTDNYPDEHWKSEKLIYKK